MNEETTLFKGSSSWLVEFGTFFVCGLIFMAALAFSFLVPPPGQFGLWALAGISLVWALLRWVLIRTRVYEVTSERLRVTTGILTRRTDELELYRVKDVTLLEPLLARMLGRGTLTVTTTDASTPKVDITCIQGARDLREQLRLAIEACRQKKGVRVTELE